MFDYLESMQRMKNRVPGIAGGLLLMMLAVSYRLPSPATEAERPRDPWVFRVNLDNIPRVLVFALDEEMWAAYDTQQGALYKVWKGGINFNAPMYDDRHNIQPSTRGVAYTGNTEDRSVWQLARNGSTSSVPVEYLGYRWQGDVATVRYKIPLDEGKDIIIEETPEYVTDQEGRPGFERVYKTLNVPDGVEVRLQTNFSGLSDKNDIHTSGKFKRADVTSKSHDWGITYAVEGILTLNPNDTTTLTAYFDPRVGAKVEPDPYSAASAEPTSETAAAGTGAKGKAEEPLLDGKHLIGLNDCPACHAIDKGMIGPSYAAIARKYEESAETIQQLADKVIKGGTGMWGRAAMTPHPDLSAAEASAMVKYILALDAGVTREQASGIAANFYKAGVQLTQIPDLIPGQNPNLSTVVPDLEFEGTNKSISQVTNDFHGFEDYFVMQLSGYLEAPEAGTYEFQLGANAGGRLFLNDQKIAEVNYHKDYFATDKGSVELQAGPNPFRVEFYEDVYGSELVVRWRRSGEEDYQEIPESAFTYDLTDIKPTAPGIKEIYEVNAPGFGASLEGVHPSFEVTTVTPEGFHKRISDVEMLPNGWAAVSTWDSTGSVYLLEGVMQDDPKKIKAHLFASGLYEIMGLEYVDGKLYALQKWELTELADTDDDMVADEYRVALDDWTASANFHEWAYGLIYRNGYFYINTNIAMGGNGLMNEDGTVDYQEAVQTHDRGKTLKIKKSDWSYEAIAHGYKAPNGIGFGVDGEIFATDNEGHFVPTNKMMHVPQEGYPFNGNEEVLHSLHQEVPEFKPPVLWMPENEVSNSPSQPVAFNMGPYHENQMVVGDIHHGGLKRMYVEKVGGDYQGAIFRFTQGLDAGVNRLDYGPDGNLYMAQMGGKGDFAWQGQCCGFQRFSYNGTSTLDMLAVRAKANGMEIEFTEPLRPGDGIYLSDYKVQQFWYETGDDVPEGGVKNDIENLDVLSVNRSPDRKKVFLEIDGMKKEHVIYINIPTPFLSETGHRLWAGETWYTLNNVPELAGEPGAKLVKEDNQLREEEKKAGWELLFDGETMSDWKKLSGDSSAGWKVEQGSLVGEGEGSLLMTEEEYTDFVLEFDWSVAPGADAGVFFRVPEEVSPEESPSESLPMAGPEMQLIDDQNHPDAEASDMHLSGAVYNMVPSRYKIARPIGTFNTSRLLARGDYVEHWLNGIMVAAYDMGGKAWKEKVQNSQYAENFGKKSSGAIAFFVQEGQLSLKNIRIRPLTDSTEATADKSSSSYEEGEAQSLFDGKSLDGWGGGDRTFFRIEDGAIVAGSLEKDIPQNEFVCTDQYYDNFELTMKVHAKGIPRDDFLYINAGIQFRSRRIPNTNMVSGYQGDIGVSVEGNVWGSLYDESRRHTMLAMADQKEVAKAVSSINPEGWQDYKIRCVDDRIQIWVNGIRTVDYVEKDKAIPRSGVICVQIHGGPAQEAWYKDISIKEIK